MPRPVGSNGDGQAVLAHVVDDRTDSPDAAAGGFEFGEVGLPDSVAFGRRIAKDATTQYRPRLSIGSETLWQQQVSTSQGTLHRGVGHVMTVSTHHGRDLAVAPRRPCLGVLGGQGFDAVDDRRRPWTLGRIAGSQPGQPPPIGSFWDTGQGSEPRNRQPRCRP